MGPLGWASFLGVSAETPATYANKIGFGHETPLAQQALASRRRPSAKSSKVPLPSMSAQVCTAGLYRAHTKGKVERPIRYIPQSLIYGRSFAGDPDLNAQAT